MKSMTSLLLCVLADASVWCRTSTTRDVETITRRVEHEGLSFLTITLPAFCVDFERSLANGGIGSDMFLGFKRRKHGSLPAFLSGLTSLVFDSSTGVLLNNPDVCAIFFIRQTCLMFKKVLLPCSSLRVKKAYDQFVQVEKEVAMTRHRIPKDDLYRFEEASKLLWGRILQGLNHKVESFDLIPRHGPGATAEKISANGKYRLRSWHDRLAPVFPFDRYGIPNLGYCDEMGSVDFFEPGSERPVRVITVPKTMKTPRIIAIEPVCMQYTQQAILQELVPTLERDVVVGPHIGFTDQGPNKEKALLASSDGSLATIDLSEASDRVSCSLVSRMLKSTPSLRQAVLRTRSSKADVPGHGVIPLVKFASMGSALCFPMEAMVFLTIVAIAIQEGQGTRLSLKSLSRALKDVRVYGDDIIVPCDYVQPVMRKLRDFNLKVNDRKSFWTGKFRESCGMDAYDGIPVTPVYIRRPLPTSRRQAPELTSLVSLRNQLYKAGLWRAAKWCDARISSIIPFPTVGEDSPLLGRHSYLREIDAPRLCKKLHVPLAYGATLRSVKRKSILDGYPALMKFFIKTGPEPIFDPKHLERGGRPMSVDIKTGWIRAL